MTDFVALHSAFLKSGLTGYEMARITGIDEEHLHDCFNGRCDMTKTEIMAVSKCLKLTPEEEEKIFYNVE